MTATPAVVGPDLAARIDTAFGSFEVGPGSRIQFPAGLPGFDRCRDFALVTGPTLEPFRCLCSVDGTPASFLTIDPHLVEPGFHCDLACADRERLGVQPDQSLLWLAIVTLGESGDAWVNLRAPIVIVPDRMVGAQILPPDGADSTRHALTGGPRGS